MFEQSRKTQEDRRKGFKKGIDANENRRRREEQTLSIRKDKRVEMTQKRRQMMMQEISGASGMDPTPLGEPSDDLEFLVKGIYSHDTNQRLQSVIGIRKLLSTEENPPISEVISSGCVPTFIHFLSCHDETRLQFESAWVLTNVASGTSEQTQYVVDQQAIPAFVQLLASNSERLREQAAWALGNIAGDSPSFRDQVLGSGALPPLLMILCQSQKIAMLRNCAWTLSNFCRGKPAPNFQLVQPAIKVLDHLLQAPDDDILADVCWALSYLTDGTNDRIEAVVTSPGIVPRVVDLLSHESPNVHTPALRVVGNIVTGLAPQTQTVLDCPRALEFLRELLRCGSNGIKKEVCWTISNITAGTHNQITQVMCSGIIPDMISLMRNAEFLTKKEIAWALSNASSCGTGEHIKYLVQQGVIPEFCNMLLSHDQSLVRVCLDALENILKVGNLFDEDINPYAKMIEDNGGADKLSQLLNHTTVQIFEKAEKLLDTYFDAESGGEYDENGYFDENGPGLGPVSF